VPNRTEQNKRKLRKQKREEENEAKKEDYNRLDP
jgi:hypothetical protein